MNQPRAAGSEGNRSIASGTEPSSTLDVHRDVIRRIGAHSGAPVLMLVDSASIDLAATLSREFPELAWHVALIDRARPVEELRAVLPEHCSVTILVSIAERVAYAARLPEPPRAILEHDGRPGRIKNSSFRRLFWMLPPGGVHVVSDRDRPWNAYVESLPEMTVRELMTWFQQHRTESDLADRFGVAAGELQQGCGQVCVEGPFTVVEKQNSHVFKLREWEADEILEARFGDAWGEVVTRRPAYSFEPSGTLTVHGEGPFAVGPRNIEVPERTLRRHEGVQMASRMLLLKDGLALPESFRHRHQRRLGHPRLVATTSTMGRPLLPGRRRELAGDHYLLDTAFPGHFGHITTEVLAMVWGWAETRRRTEDVRPIVSLNPGMSALPEFQLRIFEALGIARDEIEYVRHDEVVLVERLHAGTPEFESPRWVDREITTVWSDLYEGLMARATPEERAGLGAPKIFVSRRTGGKRDCLNTGEVESLFRSLGFAIYFPEDHPYAHQVSTFHGAEVIAGFGGSGMFTMMFAPHAKVIVLASENYTARNELLIASANGTDITYFWCPAELQRRSDGLFDRTAFKSHFTVPVRAYERGIRRAVC